MALRLKILVVGKVKHAYLAEGIADYYARLQHYTQIKLTEVKELRSVVKYSEAELLSRQAVELTRLLPPGDFLIALDRTGVKLDSPGLARLLQDCMNQNHSSLTFLIGSELGLAPELLHQADRILSLSNLTFTHDMSRLILLEQLYRAFTILAGQKYHK